MAEEPAGEGEVVVWRKARQYGDNEYLAERDARMWARRLDGASYTQIGKEFGLTAKSVHSRMTKRLRELPGVPAEEWRAQELDRLDRLQQVWVHEMEDAYRRGATVFALKCSEHLLRVQESRRKLLGMDAPEKTEATVYVQTEADRELDALLREVKAKNWARGAEDRAAAKPASEPE